MSMRLSAACVVLWLIREVQHFFRELHPLCPQGNPGGLPSCRAYCDRALEPRHHPRVLTNTRPAGQGGPPRSASSRTSGGVAHVRSRRRPI